MKKSSLFVMLLSFFTVSRVIEQDEEMSADEQPAYPKTFITIGEKLVALPGIGDVSRADADRDVARFQYKSLNSTALKKQHIIHKSTLYSSGLESEEKAAKSLRSATQ